MVKHSFAKGLLVGIFLLQKIFSKYFQPPTNWIAKCSCFDVILIFNRHLMDVTSFDIVAGKVNGFVLSTTIRGNILTCRIKMSISKRSGSDKRYYTSNKITEARVRLLFAFFTQPKRYTGHLRNNQIRLSACHAGGWGSRRQNSLKLNKWLYNATTVYIKLMSSWNKQEQMGNYSSELAFIRAPNHVNQLILRVSTWLR